MIFTALLFLYGCGAKTITKTIYIPIYPTTTTIQQEKSSEPKTVEEFILAAAEKYPFVMTELDGRFGVIEFGNEICQAIDQGHTLEEFRNRAKSHNVDPEFLDYMTVIAVPVFCPHNKWFSSQIK